MSEIVGELSNAGNIDGALSEKGILTGELSASGTLSGELSGEGKLEGELSAVQQELEIYDDSYEIVPDSGFQMLLTSDKYMAEDIIVHPIPYAEVSNKSGGYTATIGG